ncbi:shikimate dehydrogenase [Tsukamurella soli]|uniref:Shikimate dehydrogenase (NADP(+)) n=1 Tax=Tsukamurella soli TaxID=644556 RepID=A0ABP8K485_9ACTN
MSQPTRIHCALIGQGISASLTPAMHEREGRQQGLDYTYDIVNISPDDAPGFDLAGFLRRSRDAGLTGLNVTHPFKQRVIEHLDALSADAARLGAVNTVEFDESGQATGHNTDWSGFARNFARGFADVPVDTVVQLGAGGAGSAVAYAMLTRGVRTFHLIDTDRARATALAESLARMFPNATVVPDAATELAAALAGANGLVHATPVGMAQHPGIAFDPALLRPDLWVADVVYRPLVTELIERARTLGARTLSGGGMAVYQAVDAFEIFTGITPDADRMLAHMHDLIAAEVATAG